MRFFFWMVFGALALGACSQRRSNGTETDAVAPPADGAVDGYVPTWDAARSDVPTTSPCVPGHYTGDYTGQVFAAGLTFPTTGVVDITLTQVGSGEFLEVGNGTISGTADGTYPYQGTIEGRLNCGTRRLEASIVDAFVTVFSLTYNFEGNLTADYAQYEYRLENGVWDVWQTGGGPPTDGTGNGTWSGSLVP